MPNEIFISYRHSDSGHVRFLRDRLSRYFGSEGIFFDRDTIKPGEIFPDRLRRGISEAKVVLAIIGRDWLNVINSRSNTHPDYVRQELSQALTEGKEIIPILVEHNKQPQADELPECLKGLHIRNTHSLDGNTSEYESKIKLLYEQLRKISGMPPSKTPFMAGGLPTNYVPRPEEFNELLDHLLNHTTTVALIGAGGFGKTTLATALCHNPKIKDKFNHGILWITLGKQAKEWNRKIEDLIYILDQERPDLKSKDNIVQNFVQRLSDRNILLVIDDVWKEDHLKAFLQGGRRCARLITTRELEILPESTKWIDVDAMKTEEAVELLCAGIEVEPSLKEPLEILATTRLGKWPMLLKLVNGILHRRVNISRQPLSKALEYINQGLDERGLTCFDNHKSKQAVARTIDISLESLEPEEYQRFIELAIFPEATNIHFDTIGVLWGNTGGFGRFAVVDLCEKLFYSSLLLDFNLETEQIRLHNIICRYLTDQHKKETPQLHETFLSCYRTTNGWSSIPPKEPYLWDYLAYHLTQAGNDDELRSLFADDQWLNARVAQSGFTYSGYLSDLSLMWNTADAKTLENANYFADSFHCGLIRTSINSIAENHVPELVIAAVETGRWKPEQALSIAEKIPSKEQAFKLLTLLMRLLPKFRDKIQRQVFQIILSIKKEKERAAALIAMTPQLFNSGTILALDEAHTIANNFENQELRAKTLLAIAEALNNETKEEFLEQALNAAYDIENKDVKAEMLSKIIVQLTGKQKVKALEKIFYPSYDIDESGAHRIILAVAESPLSITQRRILLFAARAIKNKLFKAEAFAAVSKQISEKKGGALLWRAFAAAYDVGNDVWKQTSGGDAAFSTDLTFEHLNEAKGKQLKLLPVVVEQLSDKRKKAILRQDFSDVGSIENEFRRTELLSAMIEQLGEKQKTMALDKIRVVSRTFENKFDRTKFLTIVAEQLSGEYKRKILHEAKISANNIDNKEERAERLVVIAKQLIGEEKIIALGGFEEAHKVISTIENKRIKIKLLISISEDMNHDTKSSVLKEAFETALNLEKKEEQVELMVSVAKHMSGKQKETSLNKIIKRTDEIKDECLRIRTLVAVAEQLNGEEKEKTVIQALDIANKIQDKQHQIHISAVLANQLESEAKERTLHQALDEVRDVKDKKTQVKILTIVAKQLNNDEKIKILNDSLAIAYKIEDKKEQVESLTIVAKHLDSNEETRTLKEETLKKALDTAISIQPDRLRVEALAIVLEQLKGKEKSENLSKALSIAFEIQEEKSQAQAIATLAQYLDCTENIELTRNTLNKICSMKTDKHQATALTALSPLLKGQRDTLIIEKAIDIAFKIRIETLQTEVLTTIIEQFNFEEKITVLRQALAIARKIQDDWSRAQALAALAPHLDCTVGTEFFRQLLETTHAMRDSGAQAKSLKVIAPCLEGVENSIRAFVIACGFRDDGLRDDVLTTLIKHLATENKTTYRITRTTHAIKDNEDRAKKLASEAISLADEQEKKEKFRLARGAALAIENNEKRARALAFIAERLSGEEKREVFKEAFEDAYTIENKEVQNRTLNFIVKHLISENETNDYRKLPASEGQEKALEATLSSIENRIERAKKLLSFLPQLDEATALSYSIKCFHWLGNNDRADFLEICSQILPHLNLPAHAYESMADSINDICNNWRWL